ncbi:MAG: methyltransferase domain-containing protein [Dehalococcoidia bacterium]
MIAGHTVAKQSHADANEASRESKARRIEAILATRTTSLGDVLDIGTGSGYIASYFVRRSRSLVSVDVVDERVVRDFDFRRISSEKLPAEDATFDVVLSNHVIEHVDDQLLHLREIARVMRPKGIAYLATPNRFALLEPHFKLPILSWLPASLRDRYVRLARRGARFDVQPLTLGKLGALAGTASLALDDCSLEVARRRLPGIGRVLPDLAPLRWALPSFVVTLRKQPA